MPRKAIFLAIALCSAAWGHAALPMGAENGRAGSPQPAGKMRIVRDIPYDSSTGRFGLGDLFLPDKVGADTPIVLAIHGGGWSSGDRASWEGVARFFTEQLGFAAFNIEYRLASATNRWPACGDDCVKAARFVLSDEFKNRFSLSHDKIWICGGSAGGHLALWTLTHLPAGDVAGCVSISAIGDPALDYAVHAGRYKALFGEAVRSASAPYHAGDGRAGAHPASASFAVRASRSGDMRTQSALVAMDPRKAIVPGMAPVLCTHATEDKVVPIASHRAFADAYRTVGNVCTFFEYPSTIREGLTGHCIWVPDSSPHRLIPELESQIALFTGRTSSSLWRDFSAPPESARPWCYWWWINGHADRETITADLEAMKRLGFGGILMFDSRGYFDDEDHVVNPKAEIVWGSPAWHDLVEFSMRECARLGLEFTMNASASGGTLNGFIDGREYETDIMNRDEVVAHLDRAIGPILKRVPELVGKTFTHIYSPSYEGNVKTGGSWKTIKDTFYATMRGWAHGHGLKLYSESGGPWGWGAKSTPLDCDQLDMLAHNDFPQGEFWQGGDLPFSRDAKHAFKDGLGRFFQRGPVLSARRDRKRIVSMEAFTHMGCHWSFDPALLKPFADVAFADGANRLVWHTFTCSPKKFGVPGAEYFAGTHINRNVTWHKDAGAFVKYLARCQAMLQRGEYVDDGEFENVTTNYYGWGRFRKDENAQFTTTHRREGGVEWFFVAGEGKGEVELNASCEGRSVEIWDAVMGRKEELFTNDNCHNCSQIANANAGGRMSSCADGKTRVELDLLKGGSCFVVFAPGASTTGLTELSVDKPQTPINLVNPVNPVKKDIPITNSWHVSFAYHDGISAVPPAPVTMETLCDWTSFGEDGKADSTSLRYFSGTATYKITVAIAAGSLGVSELVFRQVSKTPKLQEAKATSTTFHPFNFSTFLLSLGSLPSGLAHVFVNGVDCGVVWCAPWEVDISSAVRKGENEIEIRYANNWHNRLVGDCFLKPEERVTRSTLHYWRHSRKDSANKDRSHRRTRYSGPSADDPLQPSGILGPVKLLLAK